MNTKELAKKHHDYIVKARRHFHQHPELSMQEKETSAYIQKELTTAGIPYEIVGDYGIIARVEGSNTDNMVALRGDIDALPIQEENDHLNYQSQTPGVMHACGHDAHTATLLGAALILNEMKSEIKGTVLFCFQQGEEVAKGAKIQVEGLAKYPVRGAFGMHVDSDTEIGDILVSAGAVMASADIFHVEVQGKGGHGSRPDLSIDPLLACASMVMELARARATETDPFEAITISVGKLHSGSTFNIVPDKGEFTGTIRSLSKRARDQAAEILHRVCQGVAQAHRVSVKININNATQIVYNDPIYTELFKTSAGKVLLEDKIKPQTVMLGSEDFSEFSERYPSVYAMLGTKNTKLKTDYPHHHPKFNLDDSVLSTGSALYAQYAIDFLANIK